MSHLAFLMWLRPLKDLNMEDAITRNMHAKHPRENSPPPSSPSTQVCHLQEIQTQNTFTVKEEILRTAIKVRAFCSISATNFGSCKPLSALINTSHLTQLFTVTWRWGGYHFHEHPWPTPCLVFVLQPCVQGNLNLWQWHNFQCSLFVGKKCTFLPGYPWAHRERGAAQSRPALWTKVLLGAWLAPLFVGCDLQVFLLKEGTLLPHSAPRQG